MKYYEIVFYADLEFFINLKTISQLTDDKSEVASILIKRFISDNLGTCSSKDYTTSVKLFLEGHPREEIMRMAGVSESKVRKCIDIYLFKRKVYFAEHKT
jgi:hypothetical protein